MQHEILSVGKMLGELEYHLLPADRASFVIIFAPEGHVEVERSI